MFGLLYKDIITHKKQLLSITPVFIFFFGWTVVPPVATPDLTEWELDLALSFSSIVIMLTLGMFEQGLLEADEMKKWQAFIASTPEGVKKQIGSKYLFCGLLSCLIFNILNILFAAAAAINGTDVTIAVMLLMQFLWLQLIIRAVEMPFLIRFGSKNGNLCRMILIMLVVFIFIVYGLFGDLSVFGSLEGFIKWLKDYLTDDTSYFLYLTPAAAWAAYFISYKISCKLYLKGGEHYDR